MTSEGARDPLSYFWAPLCAVGSHGERPNAQICVAVAGASIVPDRPRVTVTLWKNNHTHDLVASAGTLAVTLLSGAQLDLLEPLGMQSGRHGDKLDGIEHALTDAGDPYFPGGTGYLTCDVIEAFDLGDATAFLAAVRSRERLSAEPPMTWPEAQGRLGEDVMRRWLEKSAGDQGVARGGMLWR